jgi:hypothetical protein
LNQIDKQKTNSFVKKNPQYSISQLFLQDHNEISKKTFILIESNKKNEEGKVSSDKNKKQD